MRILHICGYTWNIGGPPKVIFDHAEYQLRQGNEVTILTPISTGEELYPVPQGATIVTCRRHPLARFYAEFSPELYRWLRRHGNDFDLIHVHGIWHFAGIAPFLLYLKPAKAITLHGLLDPWAWQQGRWKKQFFSWLIQRRIVRQADLIHLISRDERTDLHRYLGYDHPRAIYVPNGMNTAKYQHLPKRGQFRQKHQLGERKMVLFLSRINAKKGLDLLLPAFKNLLAKHQEAVLVLAGPDDGFLTYVENFIAKSNLQASVLLVGMLTGEEKLAAFVDADAFALPSYSEGFSIAALEALTIGTPALLSDRVGFALELREYQAAHLSDLTVEAVEAGLHHLLSDAGYSQNLRENGQRLVHEKFDINVVAEQLLAAYRQAVQRRKTSETAS
ncbi:MAG: glycosyltransferase [Cytophagaceae bacterium]|nr:glycosyltransferase [Cytophagaceae bacterium]